MWRNWDPVVLCDTGSVLSRRVKTNFLMVVLNALPRMKKKKIKNRKMIKWKFCYSAPLSPRKWRFLLPQDHSCQAPWERGQRGITLQPARLSGDCCTPWARCDQQIQEMPVPQNDPQLAWGCISGLQQERSMCTPLPVAAQSTTLPSLSGRQVGLGVWGRRIPYVEATLEQWFMGYVLHDVG